MHVTSARWLRCEYIRGHWIRSAKQTERRAPRDATHGSMCVEARAREQHEATFRAFELRQRVLITP